jgi:hypothetical protein
VPPIPVLGLFNNEELTELLANLVRSALPTTTVTNRVCLRSKVIARPYYNSAAFTL